MPGHSETSTDPARAAASAPARLVVLLVRPSKYDDEGYVITHWRGVLPSNTLSCLRSLTDDAVRSGALGDCHVTVVALDEAVDRVDPRRLARKYLRGGRRGVVALAGVQTNQLPRAADLARQFKAAGFDVMIGGFHVSGAIAMAPRMPPECQALVDGGVTLVLGEVEGRWGGLLQDAAAGRLKPLYNYLDDPPALSNDPIPFPPPRLQRKFAVRGMGTIDMSRGCPFRCSFCTIISVQGRTMRARDPERVLGEIRARAQHGARRRIDHYFFTDDNFSRSPVWEAIFDGLIAMRAEGLGIDFMMQVDIAACRIPRFVDKAARAGCVQVFIGMESIREDNLQSVGKRQNRVHTYKAAIAQWHDAGVVCHVGYIIGFPHDTYDRVMHDVRALRDELHVDQASFFVLTPLPGSEDHRNAVAAGDPLDSDYNQYDSFHVARPHAVMTDAEWMAAFRDAWREFYSFEHMERALLRQNPHTYWGLFKVFLWYRASMLEGTHPMLTGFLRLKRRTARRAPLPIEGRRQFLVRRLREVYAQCRGYAALALEMQELWLRTRIRRREYVSWKELTGFATRASTPSHVKLAWGRLHAELAEAARALRAGSREAAAQVSPAMQRRLDAMREALGGYIAPAGTGSETLASAGCGPDTSDPIWRRAARRLNPFAPPSLESRSRLTRYWRETWRRVDRLQIYRINPARLWWSAVQDARHMAVFLAALMSERY